jgi:hypothetical protein
MRSSRSALNNQGVCGSRGAHPPRQHPSLQPRYNIAPTQQVFALRSAGDGREGVFLKWGLVPSWASDASIGVRILNARAETIQGRPAFRTAFSRRRCLIPNDCVGSWCRLSWGGWCEDSRRGPRGDRSDAVSPTGSTQRGLGLRVTKDRVAASRARLHDGYEAPVPCRPRTRAGRCRISPGRAAGNALPHAGSSSRAVGGRARRGGLHGFFRPDQKG